LDSDVVVGAAGGVSFGLRGVVTRFLTATFLTATFLTQLARGLLRAVFSWRPSSRCSSLSRCVFDGRLPSGGLASDLLRRGRAVALRVVFFAAAFFVADFFVAVLRAPFSRRFFGRLTFRRCSRHLKSLSVHVVGALFGRQQALLA